MRCITLFFLLFSFGLSAQGFRVTDLSCEGRSLPLGIEKAQPRLSWRLVSGQRSVRQVAYQVLVAEDTTALMRHEGSSWNSGKVADARSVNLPYRGKKLGPARTYYWKVRVWNDRGDSSAWSPIHYWQTGLPDKQDWKGAQWIAYEVLPDSLVTILPTDQQKDKHSGSNVLPLLRKEFRLEKPVRRATLYISGLGHFEAFVNGKKSGDHFLDPGWTKYDQQALYVPLDVTKQLDSGWNAIGVMLGNGFYYVPPVKGRYRKLRTAFGYPKMICRLVIEHQDGSKTDIISDPSWKTAAGPIIFSSIFGGEDYDARREQEGWNRSGYNDANWKAAIATSGPPRLNAQVAAPLKITQWLSARSTTRLKDGSTVYDFGQNTSGIPYLRVRGNRGDTVRIIPAELLKEDGSANQKASGGPYYFDYILKGEGEESFQPRFSYYGFRYLQVKGAQPRSETPSSLPVIESISALVTTNSAPVAGSFRSSDTLFDRTASLIRWAITSNMSSVLTDCPHREKLGWLEQVHLMGPSLLYNFDLQPLYEKQMLDMRYSQLENGLVPEIAPEFVQFEWGGDMFRDSPEWGSAAVLVPWMLYQWYGDSSVLREHYPMMKRYTDYLSAKAKAGGWILRQGLGDWYDLGPKAPGVAQLTTMGVTGTAIFYHDLEVMSAVARLLGRKEEAQDYRKLAGEVKRAFNDSFYQVRTKQYATGSQTANAMAVYMGLAPQQHRAAIVAHIARDVRAKGLTAGDIGYHYLLAVLHEAGRDEVIYEMNRRSDIPGYGMQLAKGATALTESWAALPTNSNNHFMLGHLMEWFYRGLAGIAQGEGSIGWKTIRIRPRMVGDVASAAASYDSPYGRIVSEWKRSNDGFELYVEVPANSSAQVYLPIRKHTRVFESGKPLVASSDIRIRSAGGGEMKLRIGSGQYRFLVKY